MFVAGVVVNFMAAFALGAVGVGNSGVAVGAVLDAAVGRAHSIMAVDGWLVGLALGASALCVVVDESGSLRAGAGVVDQVEGGRAFSTDVVGAAGLAVEYIAAEALMGVKVEGVACFAFIAFASIVAAFGLNAVFRAVLDADAFGQAVALGAVGAGAVGVTGLAVLMLADDALQVLGQLEGG